MPSTAQGGSSSTRCFESVDIEEVVDQIGENPARWLDHDMFDRGGMVRTKVEQRGHREKVRLVEDSDVSTWGTMVQARIDGIDDLLTVRYWMEVEAALGNDGIREDCPRDVVMSLLQERADELKQIGERPDRLSLGPRQSYEEFQDGDDGLTAEDLREQRTSSITSASTSSTTSPASPSAGETSEASSLDQFAMTDGGEDQDVEE